MNSSPKVSVCIPTYNRSKYLREAIESVLMQSYTDFELIICDNASTDDTSEVVNSFNDNRIVYHRNTENLGAFKNINLCLELARGEYITIFHDDDVMLQDNISDKVSFLDNHQNFALVSSDPYKINDKGEIVGVFCSREKHLYIDSEEFGKTCFQDLFSIGNSICFSDVLCRTNVYKQLGNFESIPYCDWEMWMRISLFSNLGYILKPLMCYRIHSGMDSKNYAGFIEGYEAKLTIIKKYSSSFQVVKFLKKTYLKYMQEQILHFSIEAFKKEELNKNLLILLFYSIKLNPIYGIHQIFKYFYKCFRFKLGLGQKARYLQQILQIRKN